MARTHQQRPQASTRPVQMLQGGRDISMSVAELGDLITTARAAELLGFTETKHPLKNLWAYLRRHDIPVSYRGRRLLVSAFSLRTQMQADTRAANVRAAARRRERLKRGA